MQRVACMLSSREPWMSSWKRDGSQERLVCSRERLQSSQEHCGAREGALCLEVRGFGEAS